VQVALNVSGARERRTTLNDSDDPDPSQFLGIRLPVTSDTGEMIEERWANWLRRTRRWSKGFAPSVPRNKDSPLEEDGFELSVPLEAAVSEVMPWSRSNG
jgi:hypothetical protein